jgi:hypothetical protein
MFWRMPWLVLDTCGLGPWCGNSESKGDAMRFSSWVEVGMSQTSLGSHETAPPCLKVSHVPALAFGYESFFTLILFCIANIVISIALCLWRSSQLLGIPN